MTTSYRNTLENFQDFLLTGKNNITDTVQITERVDAHTRMGVYLEGYTSRLVDILEKDFPALKTVMGDAEFKTMARAYTKQYPADHFSIKSYGRYLPQFLTEYENKDAMCYEMAQLEWAYVEVGDAEDVEILTLEHLKTLSAEKWGELILRFQPCVQRRAFYLNTPEVWDAIHYEHEIPAIEKYKTLEYWLFWRDSTFAMYYRHINSTEYEMIKAIYQSEPLSNICETLSEKMPEDEVEQFVSARLQEWITAGLFAG